MFREAGFGSLDVHELDHNVQNYRYVADLNNPSILLDDEGQGCLKRRDDRFPSLVQTQ